MDFSQRYPRPCITFLHVSCWHPSRNATPTNFAPWQTQLNVSRLHVKRISLPFELGLRSLARYDQSVALVSMMATVGRGRRGGVCNGGECDHGQQQRALGSLGASGVRATISTDTAVHICPVTATAFSVKCPACQAFTSGHLRSLRPAGKVRSIRPA